MHPVPSIAQAVDYGKTQLLSVSPSARLDSELLLAAVLQKSRVWLISHSQELLTMQQYGRFLHMLTRRAQNEPMAYILGYQEFWSIPIYCNQSTLIPRPESELLVETLINLPIQSNIHSNQKVQVLDLGTGTGALALAIAKEKPDWQITGVDIMPDAITLAKFNQAKLNIRNVNFLCSDWFNGLAQQTFTCILSNPPYIAQDDPHLSGLVYEPQSALVAAKQGLADIETIVQQAKSWLHPGGYLLLEHGYNQKKPVLALFTMHGYQNITQHKDIAGNDRISFGQMPNKSKINPFNTD